MTPSYHINAIILKLLLTETNHYGIVCYSARTARGPTKSQETVRHLRHFGAGTYREPLRRHSETTCANEKQCNESGTTMIARCAAELNRITCIFLCCPANLTRPRPSQLFLFISECDDDHHCPAVLDQHCISAWVPHGVLNARTQGAVHARLLSSEHAAILDTHTHATRCIRNALRSVPVSSGPFINRAVPIWSFEVCTNEYLESRYHRFWTELKENLTFTILNMREPGDHKTMYVTA